MNPKIEAAFNTQVNRELFSSYLYLSMSAWFESQNLAGMASWMQFQAQEENIHAMKIYDFIHERDGRVALAQIDGPKTEWNSPLDAFEESLEHERQVTAWIYELADLAAAERDHGSSTFLQWFITEQVEEEDQVRKIIDKLRMAGDNPLALMMLDDQIGQRPAPTAADGASASG